MVSSVGDGAYKTTEAVVDGSKYVVNTTISTTGNVAHGVYDQSGKAIHAVGDTTKNIAAAGVEKTGQAWEGSNKYNYNHNSI